MSITQEQIKKLSENLSKILNNNEKIWENINDILVYFELLNEVDTTWVIPTICVVKKENLLREDIECIEKLNTKELLECSNNKILGNQIVISNIMK